MYLCNSTCQITSLKFSGMAQDNLHTKQTQSQQIGLCSLARSIGGILFQDMFESSFLSSSSNCCYNIRHIPLGLGSSFWTTHHPGQMVHLRVSSAHKHSGTESSQEDLLPLPPIDQSQIHQDYDRQRGLPVLHQSSGWGMLPITLC